ncbi:MAG: succinoglycan biosynthesis glycosyltransferase ExoA [Anaerolineae bacterium]|nr:MAG: succinoglycan biosynthesis glycosyltransferase ExoA [Anaerolineae bacterium]
MVPQVSVIVPCYNERNTITSLLEALRKQTIEPDQFEVVVADGMSSDGTRETLQAYADEYPSFDLHLLDNPSRSIPAALNKAVDGSVGRVIVRMDAHSLPSTDYVERCLEVLRETGAANVGGVWEIRPLGQGWLARGIAAAAGHPLGAGDARYRIGGKAGEVETVPFGAYLRKWLDRVGPFNEELHTNEDYEYNLRLRHAGGVIWFDPSIQSTYYARPDLPSLLRQYIRYGYWKSQMLRLYPDSIRWRQAIAPVFVITLLGLFFAGLLHPAAWVALLATVLVYGSVLVIVGVWEALSRADPGLAFGIPSALAVMHLSWGGAFLWGMIRPRVGRGKTNGQG